MARRLLALCVAPVAAALVAACGGSSGGHTTTNVAKLQPKLVAAAVVADAARKTAQQAGFATKVNLSANSSKLEGVVSITGTGRFNSRPADGAPTGVLNVTATLPGILSFVSPLSTEVILGADDLYIKLPQDLAADLKGQIQPWLSAPAGELANEAGLSNISASATLTPWGALQALARASTDQVTRIAADTYTETINPFGKTTITLDPSNGLIAEIQTAYNAPDKLLQAKLNLSFTGYGLQQIPSVPPASETTSAASILSQLSF